MHTLKYLVHVIIIPKLAFIPTFQFCYKEKHNIMLCAFGVLFCFFYVPSFSLNYGSSDNFFFFLLFFALQYCIGFENFNLKYIGQLICFLMCNLPNIVWDTMLIHLAARKSDFEIYF